MEDVRVKDEALRLIGLFEVLPRLVVFDLDYTLWPFYCPPLVLAAIAMDDIVSSLLPGLLLALAYHCHEVVVLPIWSYNLYSLPDLKRCLMTIACCCMQGTMVAIGSGGDLQVERGIKACGCRNREQGSDSSVERSRELKSRDAESNWESLLQVELRSKREMPYLYPQAKGILQAFQDKGIEMAIASRSPTPYIANTFLDELGIQSMFVAKRSQLV
ncbi:hypothetical protein M5K25_011288 [Dendrobium thyrsiflorum]|uniref:Uncharacterized protein n=1 Tax=Dendrobium thyrsiflorum TaxID=117978 RepID=A0ABD0V333_DENTH